MHKKVKPISVTAIFLKYRDVLYKGRRRQFPLQKKLDWIVASLICSVYGCCVQFSVRLNDYSRC